MALLVVLASPLTSRSFRVFFSREPRHVSELGPGDATNVRNWTVTEPAGVSPVVVEKVEDARARPDFDPIGWPDAWSVDLIVNTRLVAGATYLVIGAAGTIESQDGVDVLSPNPDDRASFPGIVETLPRALVRPVSIRGRDLLYDTFAGSFSVTGGGDIADHGDVEALKKRIIRRMISRPGGFVHLRDYGVGLRTKELPRYGDLAALKMTTALQIREEPDVEAVAVDATVSAGVLVLGIRVRPRGAEPFGIRIESSSPGVFVVGEGAVV